jgi:hypothetical protein
MRPVRSHLSYANVVSTLCLFLLLSGGTAVALSGTDTVQSDDLGPGSQVKAPDVAANAVNGTDVVDNSLTGSDISESTLAQVPSAANGARRIDFNRPETDGSPVNVLRLDEMTLKAQCDVLESTTITSLSIYVASTVQADANYVFNERNNAQQTDAVAGGVSIGANTETHIADADLVGAPVERAEGQLVYHNANRVIGLTLHAVANDSTGRCQVTGIAVPAPG